MRHAVERDELQLRFQLQIDLATGLAMGAEVLLHWHSRDLGEVPSEEFLPVARHTGLIVMLGDWQREAACTVLQNWLHEGLKPLRLALNHSALQLQQPDLVAKFQTALLSHGLPSVLIGMEVSEQALMAGSADMARKLAELRALGIEITLDDFGTGSSNLSLLRSLPVDVLKVHRSCVPDVTAASGAVSLTRAIINMAHSLQMKVLAEGVETDGQLALLVANGCDRIQGQAFSPVVDLATLESQLRAGAVRLPERFMRRQRERTLLLVDDEPNIVAALKRLFRRGRLPHRHRWQRRRRLAAHGRVRSGCGAVRPAHAGHDRGRIPAPGQGAVSRHRAHGAVGLHRAAVHHRCRQRRRHLPISDQALG